LSGFNRMNSANIKNTDPMTCPDADRARDATHDDADDATTPTTRARE